MAAALAIRIVGRDLPGRRHHGGVGDVHVGLQRGREPLGLVPGDAPVAVFRLSVELTRAADGGVDRP